MCTLASFLGAPRNCIKAGAQSCAPTFVLKSLSGRSGADVFSFCLARLFFRYGSYMKSMFVVVVVFGLLWILVFLLWAVEGNWSGKSRTHPRLYSYNPCDGLTRACLAGGGATFVLCF